MHNEDKLSQWIDEHGNEIVIRIGDKTVIGKIYGKHSDSPGVAFKIPFGGKFIEVAEDFGRMQLLERLKKGYITWLTHEK